MSAAPPPGAQAPWHVEGASERYPAALEALGDRAPAGLWGLGDRDLVASLVPEATVTIVGSRRPTPYGRGVAEELASLLAAAGFVVVSGMAHGIDAAAHRGALLGGRTVAVLGGGPDVVYPPSSAGLHREIVARGAIVSEAQPGHQPERWCFPARNRIMAALGGITVVVEAAEPSGSLITAREAIGIGRLVGAVPGAVTSRVSAGTNGLIRDGAFLIREAQDVLDLLIGVGAPRVRRTGPPLDARGAEVLVAIESGDDTGDAIAIAVKLAPAAAATALAELELAGYVKRDRGGGYVRTTLEPPVQAALPA